MTKLYICAECGCNPLSMQFKCPSCGSVRVLLRRVAVETFGETVVVEREAKWKASSGATAALTAARLAAGLLRELRGMLGRQPLTVEEVLKAAQLQVDACEKALKQLAEGA